MTMLPGEVDMFPSDVDDWTRQLAVALATIHATDLGSDVPAVVRRPHLVSRWRLWDIEPDARITAAVAKAATTSTRSRKKAVATEDSGEAISEAPAEADQGEAPSAKPKRTRAPRRKAAVSSDPAPETQSGDDGNDDA
jgi:hypothetical protein